MLKSIVYLLVMISFLTTPTRAYEAYNPSFIVLLQKQELTLENLSVSENTAQNADVPADEALCDIAVGHAEQAYGIKAGLLKTIASVESGRWNEKLGRRVSWPWTVHAAGKGYYYKSKEEAVAAVRAMQKRGMTNIDVGCMQINLKYHGKAFSNLEEALDPEKNAAYSAEFLKSLFQRNNSWQKTAMQYHSKNYRKGINYKNRLEKHYAEYVNPTAAQTLFE